MSSKVVDQATLIVLDVGENVGNKDEVKNQKSFFDQARECAGRIIERKIMSQGVDLLGVLLIGTKTKNSMAEQCRGAFKRIELLYELQSPTWEMIRNLPEAPTNKKGDWVEALVVAADYFKNGFFGKKVTHKKVVLMTNFKEPTKLGSKDVAQVIDGIIEFDLEVDVIGPEIYDDNQKVPDFELAIQLVEATKGATAAFEDTMRYLLFHRKKIVRSTPWNVDLSFGPDVKIPVSVYIRLEDKPIVKKWIKAVKDPVTLTASSSEAIQSKKVFINTENQTIVNFTEVIKGYKYGQQIIPFTENDKAMLYESGEKCMMVYGFTHASNITWQSLAGSSLYYVFGKKGCKSAQTAVECLVQCLHELNLVGIVRRVYNKGNAPKMYALMPVIDSNNYICLSMAALCYKEEIKNMAFPPTNLKKYACTDKQINAFKDLIKAMDLTKAYDESYDEQEAFPIAETVSPAAQYMLDCIAFRAMNPCKPLPQPRDEIMTLFKQPPLIETRSRSHLEKIKRLFPINEVEVKIKKRKTNDALVDDLPIKSSDVQAAETHSSNTNDIPKILLPKKTNEVMQIGTADPIADFKLLVENGKTVAELASQMTDAIENLVYYSLDGKYAKALNTIKFFRTECTKAEPSHFNDWFQKFKQALIDRKKLNILELLKEEKLGLILKEENSLSTYDMDGTQDSQLYDNDTMPNSTDLTIRSDINDMFDEI